jgi:Putative zinc-finger
MNCERCQELVSDLLDSALSREDEATLNLHLQECLDCADVRSDLESIVGFCRAHRGEYEALPNERALWLRISNAIEADNGAAIVGTFDKPPGRFWKRWLSHSWQLSFPQLAAAVAAIAVVVSLTTVVGLRRIESGAAKVVSSNVTNVPVTNPDVVDLNQRYWQQQQAINYWNARIEVNKARWNPQMRDTFDRNLSVIDQAVNDSLKELKKSPHDEVSEEMLNAALNEKIALLKEFSEL